MSTRQQIIELYRVWLYRDPNTIMAKDADGVNGYVDLVENQGWSFDQVADSLNTSDEFNDKAESKVNWWFKDSDYGPGRDPTAEEMAEYKDRIKAVGWDKLGPIEDDIRGTDWGLPGVPDTSEEDSKYIIAGKGGSKFGDADYRELLIRAAPDGPQALEDVRKDVMRWINDHTNLDSVLDGPNQQVGNGGSNTGLYERISTGTPDHDSEDGGRFFTQWGDPDTDLDKNARFEYSDILASRAGGHSTYQIYSHMFRIKDSFKDDADTTAEYNRIRNELIQRGNSTGNLRGNDATVDGVYYSWRHTLENPLQQEIGRYIRSAGVSKNADRDERFWMYDRKAYEEIMQFQLDRAGYSGEGNFSWLNRDNDGLTSTVTNDEQLRELIGSGIGGAGGIGTPGSDWTEGDYWSTWGPEGPRKDGELDLADTQKIAAGIGLGAEFTDKETDEILEKIEQKFLEKMFTEWRIPDQDDESTQTAPPMYTKAKDSWGLDIVRKGMEPGEWDQGWFDDEDNMDNSWFQTLAFGGEESIDWGYYADSAIYKQAREALGMDEVIDTVKEIREANVYVHAALQDPDSEHVEDWIPYEASFDKDTPIPDPVEIDVGDYKTPDKEALTPAPDYPKAPTINIPNVSIRKPDNLPANLTIASAAGGDE